MGYFNLDKYSAPSICCLKSHWKKSNIGFRFCKPSSGQQDVCVVVFIFRFRYL